LPAIDKNIEDVVGINPDVVVIWAGQEEDIKALEDKGIKFVGIQVDNFDDVYTKLDILGKISGKEERATEITKYSKEQLKDLSDKVAKMEDVVNWNPDSLVMWNLPDLDPQNYYEDE